VLLFAICLPVPENIHGILATKKKVSVLDNPASSIQKCILGSALKSGDSLPI